MKYKCILHYEDGLNKNLLLSNREFDETASVWGAELVTGELVYLKVRLVKE